MFPKLFQRSLFKSFRPGSQVVTRHFTETVKQTQKKSNMRIYVILGISGPLFYSFYSYATDYHFREMIDEHILIYTPWILKMFTKWFPLDYSSPYTIRRVKMPADIKQSMCELFTDMDLIKDEGVCRHDAIDIMSQLIGGEVPTECVSHLLNGDYLSICLKDFKHPALHALPGLDKIMSIDEFVAFSADVLTTMKYPSIDIIARVNEIRPKSTQVPSSFDSVSVRITRHMISSRHGMKEDVVKEYNEKKQRIENKAERKEELEKEIGILQWDIQQAKEELKEERTFGGEDAKEKIEDLNRQITEMYARLKEAKNELYYL